MALDMAQSSNEVKNIIKGWMDKRVNNIHTSMPGSIVSYDPGTNRASVQPNGSFKAQDGRNVRYPIIHNVPLHFPMGQGGTSGITFPINAGDGCLLVFSETQNDDFLSSNKGDSPDVRNHSLNDAIAIPGVYSGAAPSNVAHPGDVCLFQGGSLVQLNGDMFKVTVGGGSFTFTGDSFVGNIGGTSFTFSGGDLIVNGISHCHHTHPGCQGGSTGEPQ
jgi:hypothetical protein